MSKHKKTRKEKVIADYRHQVYILKNNNLPLDNPTLAAPVNKNPYSDTYAVKDLLKTGVLTCAIVTAQIILFFLLKRHLLLIPNLNY